MIVIAGGTGRLGTQVVQRLTAGGWAVRVLTRDATRAAHLAGPLVEVVVGDVRDPDAVGRALHGATTLISALHGFAGTGRDNPQTVDDEGNHHLITAAQRAGVAHVVLLSVQGASPDHAMELMRMKHRAHDRLYGDLGDPGGRATRTHRFDADLRPWEQSHQLRLGPRRRESRHACRW